MNIDKDKIIQNICFTELIYGIISKKLNIRLKKSEIEKKILEILFSVNIDFDKHGKNYYLSNEEKY